MGEGNHQGKTSDRGMGAEWSCSDHTFWNQNPTIIYQLGDLSKSLKPLEASAPSGIITASSQGHEGSDEMT